MFLINEENHLSIAVTDDIYKGINWLIKEDWIGPFSEVVLHDGAEIPLWEYIGGFENAKECNSTIIYDFLNLCLRKWYQTSLKNLVFTLKKLL